LGLRVLSLISESLERLIAAIERYHWKNVQIILAVVFEESSETAEGTRRLEQMIAGLSVPVAIRSYAFDDLQLRFGVTGQPPAG